MSPHNCNFQSAEDQPKMHENHGMARMQEILSSYYGMQDKETTEESLRNIDSEGFNADLYVKVRTTVGQVCP